MWQLPYEPAESGPARTLSAITVAAAGAAALYWLVGWSTSDHQAATLILLGGFALMLTISASYGFTVDRVWRRSKRNAAEAVSTFKDDFIATVSHELRTPLTGIVGYAQLLDATDLASSEADAVQAIVAQSAEMSRLVDDLVTASRLDAGLVVINDEAVSVFEAAQEAAKFLRLMGGEVSIECRDDHVRADAEMLRHMIRNLLVNAHRHGLPGVSIRGQASGDRYVLQVVDRGPGISSEMQSRLFTRFFHPGDGHRVAGSLGLGLAVVNELAAMMGCSVSYARLNGETHFIVMLPLAKPRTTEVSLALGGVSSALTERLKPRNRIRTTNRKERLS